MNAVLTKIWADVTGRPVLSILVTITVFTSALLLTLAIATLMNLSAPYDHAFDALNGAHVWLFLNRRLTSRRDVERIATVPGVVASTGLRPYVDWEIDLGDNHTWASLRAVPPAPWEVNRLLVRSGCFLTADVDEVIISNDLADLYDVGVGDAIHLERADGREVSLPIVGVAYNPMWDTYRNSQPPYVYLAEETLTRLFPDASTWGWSVGLRLRDPAAVEDTVERVETVLHDDVVDSHVDWRDVRASAIFGAQINFAFLGAFGVFATLATVLVIGSSIGSIVLSQYKQIGILKTIGFTQRQVLGLYVGQTLLLAAVGIAPGLLAGIVLAPLPLRSVAASLSTPFRPVLTPGLVVAVITIAGGTAALAAYTAARRGARVSIAQTLAVGAEPRSRTAGRSGIWATRLGLPLIIALGWQNVLTKPLRSLLTAVNLMLGVVGIVFGLTLNTTLEGYEAHPERLGLVYDAAVTRGRSSDTKTRHVLSGAPGIEAVFSESLVTAETHDGKSFQVRAVEGDLDAFPFQILAGRQLRPATQEAIAGLGLLSWLDLKLGDTLMLTFEDGRKRASDWTIVGEYPEPVNQGQRLMVDAKALTRALPGVEPVTYYLRLADAVDRDALRAYLRVRSHEDLDVVFVDQALPDAVVYLQAAIYALSAILIGIALVNVFTTTLMATREKLRMVGVLKTVGMTPLQVVAMVNVSAGLLGCMALLVGVPLGLAFTRAVLVYTARSYGFGEVQVVFEPVVLLALVPAILALSVAGAAIPSLQAAHTSIVKVLRYG